MDIKEIKRILELMKENELAEFELEDQGFRLALKSRGSVPPNYVIAPPAGVAPVAAAPAPAAAAEAAPAAKAEDGGWIDITSPIVGTFYRSPSPDAEPFASVGQEVEEDTVVCIIEAMKVMNEIKAEVSGVIRKICVENATPVQYGQPLFLVEPA